MKIFREALAAQASVPERFDCPARASPAAHPSHERRRRRRPRHG